MENSLFFKKPESTEQYFNNINVQRPGGSGFYVEHTYEHIECKSITEVNTVHDNFSL